MNQLVQLTVDGYKSIQHMDMRFTNINILIGGNGAGKSICFLSLKCCSILRTIICRVL